MKLKLEAGLKTCIYHESFAQEEITQIKEMPSSDIKTWDQLTLREKINAIVDRLAGIGMIAAIANNEYIISDFPFEQIHVTTNGKKATGSLEGIQQGLEL